MIQLLVCTFLALVAAVVIAEHWRERFAGIRHELADAQHDNAVLHAELEACRGTRRQLAHDIDARVAADQRQRERMAP